MRRSTLAMVRDAHDNGYAVPAFNVVDDLSLRAVVDAAEEAGSPVIIQASLKTARSIGVELLTEMFDAATARCRVDTALHLDHCPDLSMIERVVAARWSSVLFDASDRDLGQAVAETSAVVGLAHAAGVDVESEIENIVGVEDGVGSDVIVHSYSVEQLADAIRTTGADLIAPQLGTAHGAYHGRPTLLPHRVRELRELVDCPVVLHGGTGLTEAEFRSLIAAGVSKINISTAVKHAYMDSAYHFLKKARAKDEWDPPSLFRSIAGEIRAVALRHFDIFGSAGRSPGVQS
ncbi:class II fructose-bisphosphate aldolase [Actinotalea sp. M2MS4P-6]|uniref:class II fructose-bisphosphate aldolase n=1 Tax=Actinotalea sp. M2MS4P-6 TaxID=2983762 RepID=UPI0021E4A73C|nr:class II fructose-bisphosphate aldolase [Actinotalea sp. M2MS4P-6]MCV2395654.1 class II fructose-bisphosphate aldolase [Actinotalea sp. M2MS4P-6]